jgi:hypothetical protein
MYNPWWAYAERILSHTEHTWNKFHRMLSILGTDFIACWACAEMFKSRIFRPNRIRFSKISCYRPLGPYGFGFCKKSIKKFHACVPLTYFSAFCYNVLPIYLKSYSNLSRKRTRNLTLFSIGKIKLWIIFFVPMHRQFYNNDYFLIYSELSLFFVFFSKIWMALFIWTSLRFFVLFYPVHLPGKGHLFSISFSTLNNFQAGILLTYCAPEFKSCDVIMGWKSKDLLSNMLVPEEGCCVQSAELTGCCCCCCVLG